MAIAPLPAMAAGERKAVLTAESGGEVFGLQAEDIIIPIHFLRFEKAHGLI